MQVAPSIQWLDAQGLPLNAFASGPTNPTDFCQMQSLVGSQSSFGIKQQLNSKSTQTTSVL